MLKKIKSFQLYISTKTWVLCIFQDDFIVYLHLQINVSSIVILNVSTIVTFQFSVSGVLCINKNSRDNFMQQSTFRIFLNATFKYVQHILQISHDVSFFNKLFFKAQKFFEIFFAKISNFSSAPRQFGHFGTPRVRRVRGPNTGTVEGLIRLFLICYL